MAHQIPKSEMDVAQADKLRLSPFYDENGLSCAVGGLRV